MSWQGEKAFEKEVVAAFMAMPSCSLKQALGQLVLQLARQVSDLHCPESQGDGQPCSGLEPDCVSCQGWEERLRQLLPGFSPTAAGREL